MDQQVYQDMIKQQETHWWFKARREIVSCFLKRYFTKKNASILEIGCGMGGNIPMLKQLSNDVDASDTDDFAVSYTKEKYNINIQKGVLPFDIPFNKQYDLICMFDVLEHVEKNKEALQEIEKRLTPGGKLIITVPAYMWLWGAHDVFLHHFRRYTIAQLETIVKKNTQLKIVKKTYFNIFLLPLAFIARIIDKIKPSEKSTGYDSKEGIVNSLLYNIFRIERKIIPKITLPFGVSILFYLEKK